MRHTSKMLPSVHTISSPSSHLQLSLFSWKTLRNQWESPPTMQPWPPGLCLTVLRLEYLFTITFYCSRVGHAHTQHEHHLSLTHCKLNIWLESSLLTTIFQPRRSCWTTRKHYFGGNGANYDIYFRPGIPRFLPVASIGKKNCTQQDLPARLLCGCSYLVSTYYFRGFTWKLRMIMGKFSIQWNISLHLSSI